jgi:hypothetical protein
MGGLVDLLHIGREHKDAKAVPDKKMPTGKKAPAKDVPAPNDHLCSYRKFILFFVCFSICLSRL